MEQEAHRAEVPLVVIMEKAKQIFQVETVVTPVQDHIQDQAEVAAEPGGSLP